MKPAPQSVDITQSCYARNFTYPGERPGFPFLTDCVYLYPLNTESGIEFSQWEFASSGESVNRFLAVRGEVLIGDRYPVLAYGANRNPDNLAWKFSRAGITGVVIGLPVTIHNADVVAANMFHSGHMYADLMWDREETQGVSVDAVILLLDEKQLCLINRTERVPGVEVLQNHTPFRGARLSLFEDILLETSGHRVFALGYVSWANTWAPDGQPIAYRNIKATNRRFSEMTPMEMFCLVRQRYRNDLSLEEMMTRMDNHWKTVCKTNINGYETDWFRRLIDEINNDGMRERDGELRTGIRDAGLRDSLLTPQDTWKPGSCYKAGYWQS